MELKSLQPRTRVARVAPLVPAITAARARGVAWSQIAAEIGTAIGIEPGARGAADAVRIACREAALQLESGRLKLDSTAAPGPSAITAGPIQTRTAQPTKDYPLPGQKAAPIDGMSDMEKLRAEFDG